MTAVDTGEVKVEDASGSTFLTVAEGFFEVAGEHARLLSDVGEKADEIDLEWAPQRPKKRARERLLAARRPDLDFCPGQAALRRAIARQKVVRYFSSGTGGADARGA